MTELLTIASAITDPAIVALREAKDAAAAAHEAVRYGSRTPEAEATWAAYKAASQAYTSAAVAFIREHDLY